MPANALAPSKNCTEASSSLSSGMRVWRSPCHLTHEDALRLRAVLLRRFDGTRSVRDLMNRHRFAIQTLEAAAAVGIIRLEKRQPHTGRPSLIATLEPDAVNKTRAAKLPCRAERPLPLSFREEDFLIYYMCRRGMSPLAGFGGGGSAAEAYMKSYGSRRKLTAASARSAGARLARRPWMRAAFLLSRRLPLINQRAYQPDDLRSAGREWLQLASALCKFGDWPADACAAILSVRTYPEAIARLRNLPKFIGSAESLAHGSG